MSFWPKVKNFANRLFLKKSLLVGDRLMTPVGSEGQFQFLGSIFGGGDGIEGIEGTTNPCLKHVGETSQTFTGLASVTQGWG